jgi:hypothetical protein
MARAQFLTKADKAFEKKLQILLAPLGYIHIFDHGDMQAYPEDLENAILTDEEILVRHWKPEFFDFEHVEHLFMCYGYYLELIDPEIDMSTADVKERLKL